MFHKYNEYCYSRKIFIDFYDTNIKYIVSLPDNLKQIKMKKLIYLLLLIAACSCSSKDEPKAFKIDSNAMISIKPSVGAWRAPSFIKTNDTTHLSALEIVKQAEGIMFYNISVYGDQPVGRGFSASQRDTISPMLKMWGTDIIDQDGNYVPDFIESTDCILRKITNVDKPNMVIDTIAYISNSVLRNAETQIKEAYAKKDNESVYKIFNEAFTFTPITGAEWRALKTQNLQ